jgi:hypothetical protein
VSAPANPRRDLLDLLRLEAAVTQAAAALSAAPWAVLNRLSTEEDDHLGRGVRVDYESARDMAKFAERLSAIVNDRGGVE